MKNYFKACVRTKPRTLACPTLFFFDGSNAQSVLDAYGQARETAVAMAGGDHMHACRKGRVPYVVVWRLTPEVEALCSRPGNGFPVALRWKRDGSPILESIQ